MALTNIDKIFLLNERYYQKVELGIEKTQKHDYMKIKQVNIEKRLSFKVLTLKPLFISLTP